MPWGNGDGNNCRWASVSFIIVNGDAVVGNGVVCVVGSVGKCVCDGVLFVDGGVVGALVCDCVVCDGGTLVDCGVVSVDSAGECVCDGVVLDDGRCVADGIVDDVTVVGSAFMCGAVVVVSSAGNERGAAPTACSVRVGAETQHVVALRSL